MPRTKEEREKARKIASDLIEKRKRGELKIKTLTRDQWIESSEDEEILELKKNILHELDK
ncbi:MULTISPECIES: hypothetical protein [unclassified Oleiphilus]|uniref:hypothetical protein n=1 Tax=unclassified Oleiphilus TaxID=2631174 RepID=UPI0007C3D33B|nr:MULTISPECIES: hypothetical protein [unclassified Oleiphilus]KZY65614.1 hypothetical protein A3738_08300 [Oleiphilus sp. HI0066]KZY71914.1 hypothetical protein A3739_03790 [Oleiphilus sp. HI0067]